MLKTDLVTIVAQQTGLNQRQASECVASFIEQITNALARGESVNLMGFGRFSLKHTAKRQGRHPKTGETITIAAHNGAAFKAGTAFKLAVGGTQHD
ncbi:MAG: HU family DNA-binding protein [Marinagarivorans sp.]|nr:HU family DNA-binding protein [Marinagarivorans sp.]